MQVTRTNNCPLCGAEVDNGIEGCFALFYSITSNAFPYAEFVETICYTTDAHALQHPEKHGKKNNGYHLAGLCWLFEFNGKPNNIGDPKILQQYFSSIKKYPDLEPPEFRGEMNISNLRNVTDPSLYKQLAKNWAYSVYQAWELHHKWARDLINTLKIK